MEKYLIKTKKIGKSLILALLLMGVVIVVANAAPTQPPLPTSYWGSITENGSSKPNTLITVLDATGNVIVNATSDSAGSYLVIVPWDDPATTQVEGVVANETINFKVSGKTVTSRVIDAQGTNNKLDLNVPNTTTINGDVDGDGQVTVVDALFVAQYTVGTRTLTSAQLAAADVNNDGQVTVVDALFIAQFTVGLRQL